MLFNKIFKNKESKEFDKQFNKTKQEYENNAQDTANGLNKLVNVKVNQSKFNLDENDRKRIVKNCEHMRKKKLPYMEEMRLIPTNSNVKIKTKEEIVDKMLSEYVIARKAINRLNNISDIQDTDFIESVLKFQVPQETIGVIGAISNGQCDLVQLNQLAYFIERVNVYLWVLGLHIEPSPRYQCMPGAIAMQIDDYKNKEQLLSKCKMISNEKIMDFADLITRYEWAMIELNRNNQHSKYINNDSVIEQKKAIDWIVSFDSNDLLEVEENKESKE